MSHRRILPVLAASAALVAWWAVPAAQAAPPNDPFYAPTAPVTGLGQWGQRQVHAEQAWAAGSTGQGATIAVIDTGVDLHHEDLAANLLPGNTFVHCGPRGCGDGSFIPSNDTLATPQHGTHVAGIAAAVKDNGTGIAGVAPAAKVLPLTVFDGQFASTDDLAYALDYATAQGVDVVNLSLGELPGLGQLGLQALDEYRPMLEAAIANANAHGVLIVAAAGNESSPLCDFPSWAEGVLCVRATTVDELPADYSNAPVKPGFLAVSAPGGGTVDYMTKCGGGIVSTVPTGYGDNICGYAAVSPGLAYAEMIGTSMASPHVAGVAALVAAHGCTREQTLDILTSTARHPVTGARGTFTPDYGYGIVDAEAASVAAVATCATATTTTGGTGNTSTATGAIAGTVLDGKTHAGVPGATVDCGPAGATATSDTGAYSLASVPVGTYTCTASAAGYAAKSASVTVADGAAAAADFRLSPATKKRR